MSSFALFCLTSWKHSRFCIQLKKESLAISFYTASLFEPIFNLNFASRFDCIWDFYHKLLQIIFRRSKNTYVHVYVHVQTNEGCHISLSKCHFPEWIYVQKLDNIVWNKLPNYVLISMYNGISGGKGASGFWIILMEIHIVICRQMESKGRKVQKKFK